MLLTVADVAKSYADSVVLDGATLRVAAGEKVALVGRNGSGKTTLLRIMVGEEEPDRGNVQIARGATIGYLRQHTQLDERTTVLQAAEEARAHLVEMERRLRELEARLEAGPTEDDLEEYGRLHEHFHAEGGYSVERDLKTVLKRMGFGADAYTKPVSALSGGEKTRLMLSRLLLEEPDLLILDEPTNHLDLEATEWLEGWVRGYGGAVLMVSHDRTFLEATAQRVLDLRDGKVKSYPGPFGKFLELRAEEDARLAEVASRQQDQIDKLDEYVRRFMNSQRTAQARGRLKQMEKLKASQVQAPRHERGMSAAFRTNARAGDRVIECKGLGMRFGDRRLFSGLEWKVGWGERWGVVGANGVGKTTLVKLIVGELAATEGFAKIGANTQIGVFTQDNRDLDLSQTPLEMLNTRCGLQAPEARNLLGRFLIVDDDALRPIRTLSGGERNKLVLAKLTAERPNVLILDEPTNHLDMDSREALAEVLREFDGTLVLVSHDRWLLDHTTDRTLDIRRDGHATYPGAYAEYRRWRDSKTKTPPPAPVTSAAQPEPDDDLDFLTPRELSKEIARVEKLVRDLEEEVTRCEASLEVHERKMAKPPPDSDLLEMSQEYVRIKAAVDGALARWEEQSAYLERLAAAQGGSV